jgi:hypothetical protein
MAPGAGQLQQTSYGLIVKRQYKKPMIGQVSECTHTSDHRFALITQLWAFRTRHFYDQVLPTIQMAQLLVCKHVTQAFMGCWIWTKHARNRYQDNILICTNSSTPITHSNVMNPQVFLCALVSKSIRRWKKTISVLWLKTLNQKKKMEIWTKK